jgi:hypothetical protein
MILSPPGQQPSVPADGQKPLHVITRLRRRDEQLSADLGGFGRSCTKMPVEQIWVICAEAVATRLVAVIRSGTPNGPARPPAAAGAAAPGPIPLRRAAEIGQTFSPRRCRDERTADRPASKVRKPETHHNGLIGALDRCKGRASITGRSGTGTQLGIQPELYANIRRSGPFRGRVPVLSHVSLTALLITNGDHELCIRRHRRNSRTSA